MKNIYIITILAFIAFPIFIASYTNAADTSTNSANTIREKVREKIETVKSNPKAYLGTVTDKTQDSLQMKNIEGEIKFVSIIPENVAFVKTGKTTSAVKFADLAIGDFIVAMGYLNHNQSSEKITSTQANNVLNAKRILITQPLPKINRINIYADIVKKDKKTITVKLLNSTEINLTFSKKWKGPEIKELSVGDKIYATLLQKENMFEVRTIEIGTKLSPTPTKKPK